MSFILDDGPHTIVVFPQQQRADDYGNVVQAPGATGVVVRGVSVMALQSRLNDGRIQSAYRVYARAAPIGPWSRVVWNGRDYFVLSGPAHVTASPGVQHVSAIIREER